MTCRTPAANSWDRASCGFRVGRCITLPSSPCTAASSGTPRSPMTALSGCSPVTSPLESLAVSRGLSTRTVCVPTRMASMRRRIAWLSASDSGEEIHWLVPSSAAIRLSRVCAMCRVTKGRLASTASNQRRFSSSACSAASPLRTLTPASRRVAAPPAAGSWGSSTAYTTSVIPASMMACAQGPVRPTWLHGSSVTTMVEPVRSTPALAASAIASASACAVPAPR